MNTFSIIEKIEWSESPNIVVAGKKVPITYIINPTLSVFKENLASKIDEAINESCDFKPFVAPGNTAKGYFYLNFVILFLSALP